MVDWKKVAVKPDYSIKKVVDIIDKSAMQIALVTDDKERLLGTVTDGDIRRGLLKGVELDSKIELIANKNPHIATSKMNDFAIKALMKRFSIKQLPVVDESSRLINLIISESLGQNLKENPVVIMAGGLGTRLRPLTRDCPKPLLKIGGKPILEIILDNFISEGFDNFYFSINYKGQMIRDYFGNGSNFGVSIKYIEEDKKLGTAGSLSLLRDSFEKPMIVMNGDLLTKVNFGQLLDFHKENNHSSTMCVRNYEIQIPYGVVNIDGSILNSIEEKPVHKFFVNAGIYVLNPELVKFIPQNKYYDMTDLFRDIVEKKMKTGVFPIKEYWVDIGRLQDFETANYEYAQIFSS
ncbi:MAG: alcohol dehydrogenase [Deltaproteobacteria bacterium]|nr:MAG: alcohol dehydrogenase [Deltaproteobacteria bacterium]PIE75018.1 MAG: alcohol dehydrogenase [Deltaproteobacteria bacterium]